MEANDSIIQKYLEPLYAAKGWITFMGVMTIIQGIMCIISIWGIIICWLPIWMGILLIKASGQLQLAYETKDEKEAIVANQKLAKYFKLMAIFTIIFIVVGIIGIFAAILIPILASRGMMMG